MIVIDPEVLIILTESDCREEKVICGLLDVFVLPARKADGSGYRLCVGTAVNGEFKLLEVDRSGNVYGSIKRELTEFCNSNNMNANKLNYKGAVIGDDVFALLYANSGVNEKVIRDNFYMIRRLWLF